MLLRPRHERKITKREYDRIKAGILAVGLIEPFLVFPKNDYYIILNGLTPSGPVSRRGPAWRLY